MRAVAETHQYVRPIDVSGLPAGAYQVAVHREGESWRMFSAELR